MKKLVAILLAVLMCMCMTSSFAEEEAVNTGLAMITVVTGKDAAADKDGLAQTEVAIAAVTVDANGVVDSCVIDTIRAQIKFNAEGKLTTEKDAKFASKNVLGDAYGMRVASSIGKEWNEQADAFAQWCVGKTLEEITGIAVDESGKAADADLVASVTLKVGEFVDIVEKAINNAKPCGAKKGDKLVVSSVTVCSSSKDATAEKDGNAQAYAMVSAVTLQGDVITGCSIDAVQANCSFDATGKVTADLSGEVATKNELGDGYGMRPASALGKEWNEQAQSFCEYVTGKTVADVVVIPVDETTKTTDADLAAVCTIKIGTFLEMIAQIAE